MHKLTNIGNLQFAKNFIKRLQLLLLFPMLFFLLLCAKQSVGQKATKTVYGYVEDSLTGERLIGANLIVELLPKPIVAATNSFGYFTLSFAATETDYLTCTHVGYCLKTVSLNNLQTNELIIKIVPEVQQETEAIVTSAQNKIATENIGAIKLSGNLIKKMPKFLGDNDPLKVMQTMPGVTQGMEGTTALIVRGGSPDQNLFLLDGVPVYNPSHLGGIFSSFNGDAIKDITLYKGNFPARFGERLSSVIDLSTKDGNMKKLAGEGAVGMLAAKVLLEGPIKKDKSSFMVSARRSYWDVLSAPFITFTNTIDENRKIGLYFYDINAKLNYILSPKNRLYLSFFNSRDNFKIKTNSSNNSTYQFSDIKNAKMGWQNITGSLRWNHLFSSKLFSNTTVYATQYKIVTNYNNTAIENGTNIIMDGNYFSSIKDIGLKTDLEYMARNINNIKFGFSASYKNFYPASSSKTTTNNGILIQELSAANGKQESPELALYVEDFLKFSEKINTNIGVRYSAFCAGVHWYESLEPRISFNYKPKEKIRLSASYSQMRQYLHLLANNSVSLPTDIWVPATNSIKPLLSTQVSVGAATSLSNTGIDLSVEAYYKELKGVVEYKDGESYLSTAVKNWESVVEAGEGKAYGLELLLQKKTGRSTGWAGYSYSRSTRVFPTINGGKPFDFKYDRRNVINLVYMYQLSKRWRFSANWVFQNGTPFTLATSTFKAIDVNVINPSSYNTRSAEYISGRNEFRLLNYHRLDLGFNWSKKKKSFVKYWDFSFYNVYNRKNPMLYFFESDYYPYNSKRLKGIGFLPIVPSISYGLKF